MICSSWAIGSGVLSPQELGCPRGDASFDPLSLWGLKLYSVISMSCNENITEISIFSKC
jgi:hypothetical protein